MTVPWRVAKSLLVLRDQIKAAYPGTPNPGFIGDAEHASRESDHNPWVDDPASPLNVVTAGDWYNRPALGFLSAELAEVLKQVKDPRVKYVISERRIWSLARDAEGWRPYFGDPHTGHCHVSVSSVKSRYDDTRKWVITLPDDDVDPAPPKEDEVLEADIEAIAARVATKLEPRLKAYATSVTKFESQTDAADAARAGAAAEAEILTDANIDRIATAVAAKITAGT